MGGGLSFHCEPSIELTIATCLQGITPKPGSAHTLSSEQYLILKVSILASAVVLQVFTNPFTVELSQENSLSGSAIVIDMHARLN